MAMARSDTCLRTVAVFCFLLSLMLCANAVPTLTLVAETQLDTTTSFLSLSTKMIPIAGGSYRLCVGGVGTTGSVPKFVTRDVYVGGTIPLSTSENNPKLPATYTTASDISVMDSSQNKCFYSVLHQESASASSYAIVQADIGPPATNPIALETNILTVNASSTTQTYLINSAAFTLTTAFTSLSISGVTSMCGSVISDTSIMYAVGRKAASVLVGFDGQSTSVDVQNIGYQVACDALSSSQWIVCYDTQTAASTVSCRTKQNSTSTQLLTDKPSLSLTRPSVAYLNTNGVAAVVMQTNASIYQIVVVDSSSTEILRYQSEQLSYGYLLADAMNNVLSVVFNNGTGLWVRTYLFDSGLGATPTVVSPLSVTPTSTPSSSPTSTPTSTPSSSPASSPTSVPSTTPAGVPVSGPVGVTSPVAAPEKAPIAAPSASNTPNDAIGAAPTPDNNATGADAKVLGPAIAIPLAAVAAGVFLLVFFLRKKKKAKAEKKKDDEEALDGDSNLTVINPAADPGRYSAIVNAAKDDGINPTAIQPSEIDKRMQIPYKSLRFIKEIGAGSYGKVFVGEWRGAQVAIKVSNSITDIDGFLSEAKLTLGITPHPNLVQTFGVSLDGPNPCIVLEFCGGGSLDNVVFDREKHVTDEQRRDYALKIAYGLLHLHNNNIVHRDLAARNILLTNDGQPKISDFGMSRIVQEESSQGKTKTSFGPIRWMAPESLKDRSYSTKSDVWSYGILLYELVAGTEPHTEEDQLSIAVRIRDSAVTPAIPSNCDPVLKQVMEMCWKPDPNERPSMETIAEFLRSH